MHMNIDTVSAYYYYLCRRCWLINGMMQNQQVLHVIYVIHVKVYSLQSISLIHET